MSDHQPIEEKKNASELTPLEGVENDGKVEMSDLIKALTSSMRAMNSRTLPTWDITSKNQSIKAHIKSAENMARRLNWSEKETASELMLSLRGEAKNIADSLPFDTQTNFRALKLELLKLLHTEKPKAQILDEFYNYEWRYERQSIPQYAAILRNKLRKMNEDKPEQDNEIFLRSRLLQGIKNRLPEFGATLELMDLDEKDTNELANFAQRKFDVYKLNNDIRDENFAALIADKQEDTTIMKEKKYQKQDKAESHNRKAWPEAQRWIQEYQPQEYQSQGYPPPGYPGKFERRFGNKVQWQDTQMDQMNADPYHRQSDMRLQNNRRQYDARYDARYDAYRQDYYPQKRRGNDEFNPRFQNTMKNYYGKNPPQFGRNTFNNQERYGLERRTNRNMRSYQDRDMFNMANNGGFGRKFWNENQRKMNMQERNSRIIPDRGTTVKKHEQVEYLKARPQEKN